jgi:hypothetical protein
MSQDSIHLERPMEVEFTNMWDAMNRIDEPLVIEGSAETDKQLVRIIRKKIRAEQLPRTIAIDFFFMSQDSIHLERPMEVEFTNMWDAMNRIDEPLVIEGSAETDKQLVRIIRKTIRAEQLPHTSDRPFANLRGSHNGTSMANPWVPSTNKHARKKQRICKLTILSDLRKCSNTATSPIKR